jgi:molecular chaperone GrpE
MPERATDNGQAVDERPDAEALAAENASLRDRLLRALADIENTRRQAERSNADARQYAISDFARELLGVADNLERAIAAAESPSTTEDSALLEGVRATQRLLGNALERFGVERIPAQDAPFDPQRHEAMMEADDPSRPPGTVTRVLEDGYTIRDRLLRPSRVVVSRRRPDAPVEDAPDLAPGGEPSDRET